MTSVFNAGLRPNIKSYRPFSILSCAGSMLDKLGSQRLGILFNPILTERKQAYLSGASTTTYLLEFVTGIINEIKHLLGFFQSLRFHGSLDLGNSKLRQYGADGNTVVWIGSYRELSHRTRVPNHIAVPFHRTVYGKHQPLNGCHIAFISTSKIFLTRPSKKERQKAMP